MKRIIFPILILSTLFTASMALAQAPAYGGPLLYSMRVDTSIPPLYLGQPSAVTTAYLWLDDLMRLEPENLIENYISSLSWNDTTQTIASNLYQIQDDNPLSYYNWDGAGLHPNPYQGSPGQAEYAFENQVKVIAGSNASQLLFSEVIADVTISDTVCVKETSSDLTMDMVLANCVINDEIKGKWVPACPMYYKTVQKNPTTLGVATTPFSVYPLDTASVGTCLQFEYSPEWQKDAGDDMSSNIGWWVKPGHEYIVFLYFLGIGYDGTYAYFTTRPNIFGHCAGMYPVVDGIVQDPNDDFHLGSTSLTVAAWKAALRAKIYTLTHP